MTTICYLSYTYIYILAFYERMYFDVSLEIYIQLFLLRVFMCHIINECKSCSAISFIFHHNKI